MYIKWHVVKNPDLSKNIEFKNLQTYFTITLTYELLVRRNGQGGRLVALHCAEQVLVSVLIQDNDLCDP